MNWDLRFNEEHYRKVREARQRLNLPSFSDFFPENGKVFGHELEGKKLRHVETGKVIYIQSVHKHWYKGWYYALLVYTLYKTNNEDFVTDVVDGEKFGRSHGLKFWENISSIDSTVLKIISKVRNEWEII